MNPRRRVFLYLVLNILISALVTGTILYFYNRLSQKDCTPSVSAAAVGTPAADQVKVAITGIQGSGVLADETTIIHNNGQASLMLTGWTLKNNLGSTYSFPQLMIFPGGTVELHSTTGVDSAADLYWQRSSPAWASGDLAVLYDADNIARAFYRVP